MKQISTEVVLDEYSLNQLVEDYFYFSEWAFDVETLGTRDSRDLLLPGKRSPNLKDDPGLDCMTNQVFWISFAGPGRSDVIPLGHPVGPPQMDPDKVWRILEPLMFSAATKIGANVKFDLISVAKYYDFAVPPPPYIDVQTMTHILDENLFKHGGFNLENLAQKIVHYNYKEKLGNKVSKVSFERAARYSVLDSKMAYMVWKILQPHFDKNPTFQWLLDLEMDVLNVLIQMYLTGVYVDRGGFWAGFEKYSNELLLMEQEVHKLAGQEFNLRSPKQRAEFFYKTLGLRCDFLTEKGAESTNMEALRALASKSPVAKALIDYSSMAKLVNQYFKGFIPHIQEDTRIRAHYKNTGPVTGRFACGRPNIQNIPIRRQENFDSTVVRKLFIAPEDLDEEYVLLVGDYSQIELRILAHQTEDPKLMMAYRENIDLHRLTASMVYHVTFEEVLAWQRVIGKTSNFNFAFEGGPSRVKEAVEKDGGKLTLREAIRVYEAWHRAYPKVRRWGDYQKKIARQRGYVETLYGRRRRLPEIRYKGTSEQTLKARRFAERQAVNQPIQGSAGDIAKIAIVRIDEALRGSKASLVAQVHDEFIVQAPRSFADEGIELMREAMEGVTDPNGKPILSVPLLADIHMGSNWSEAK